MNLKSKNAIKYSFGDVNGDTELGIVEGFITRQQTDLKGVKNFLYSYKTPEGVSIKTGWLQAPITKAQADALYEAVKVNLPDIDIVGYSEWNEVLIMESFRVEMASTFDVLVADIEIVA